jgi:hypothetical protein
MKVGDKRILQDTLDRIVLVEIIEITEVPTGMPWQYKVFRALGEDGCYYLNHFYSSPKPSAPREWIKESPNPTSLVLKEITHGHPLESTPPEWVAQYSKVISYCSVQNALFYNAIKRFMWCKPRAGCRWCETQRATRQNSSLVNIMTSCNGKDSSDD